MGLGFERVPGPDRSLRRRDASLRVVADQERALKFYLDKLGFEKRAERLTNRGGGQDHEPRLNEYAALLFLFFPSDAAARSAALPRPPISQRRSSPSMLRARR